MTRRASGSMTPPGIRIVGEAIDPGFRSSIRREFPKECGGGVPSRVEIGVRSPVLPKSQVPELDGFVPPERLRPHESLSRNLAADSERASARSSARARGRRGSARKSAGVPPSRPLRASGYRGQPTACWRRKRDWAPTARTADACRGGGAPASPPTRSRPSGAATWLALVPRHPSTAATSAITRTSPSSWGSSTIGSKSGLSGSRVIRACSQPPSSFTTFSLR